METATLEETTSMKTKRTKSKLPQAPEFLSDESRRLWSQIITKPASAGRLELLTQALLCRDRLATLREAIKTEPTSNLAVPVYLYKIENDLRRELTRMYVGLGLQWDIHIDGRIIPD
jgi:hypothetical protein